MHIHTIAYYSNDAWMCVRVMCVRLGVRLCCAVKDFRKCGYFKKTGLFGMRGGFWKWEQTLVGAYCEKKGHILKSGSFLCDVFGLEKWRFRSWSGVSWSDFNISSSLQPKGNSTSPPPLHHYPISSYFTPFVLVMFLSVWQKLPLQTKHKIF